MSYNIDQEYETLDIIGEGANATIYKVRHKELGYVRAIKVLNRPVLNEDDKVYQTFLKECMMLLKIGNGCHPNIVRIYRPRLINGHALVEMDYVRGQSMTEYIEKTKFIEMDEVYRFVREVVGALAYCHVDIYHDLMSPDDDQLDPDPNDGSKFLITPKKREELVSKYGVTHNDIHSKNIMRRDYDGKFILLDFGLAIQNDSAVKSSSRRAGAVEYMSPEKWQDQGVVTFRSDIYSLGVLLYEVLAGQVPFPLSASEFASQSEREHKVAYQHSNELPPPIEPIRARAFEVTHPGQNYEKDYPAWLEYIIMKCLRKKPEERYANARELLTEFEKFYAAQQEGIEVVRI